MVERHAVSLLLQDVGDTAGVVGQVAGALGGDGQNHLHTEAGIAEVPAAVAGGGGAGRLQQGEHARRVRMARAEH